MKRVLLVLFAVVMSGALNAQVYFSENFDACALPAGWTTDTIPGSTIDSTWQIIAMSTNAGVSTGNLDGTCFASFDDDNIGSAVGYNGAYIESPIVSFPAAGPVYLEFDYNYNNIGLDRFIIQVFDGSTWVSLDSLAADDCGVWGCAAVGEYPRYKKDVSSFANNGFRVRWVYDDDPAGGADVWAWYTGFDNVSVSKPLPDDVGVVSISSPAEDGCGLGSAVPVTCKVQNFGSTTVTSIAMALQVDGGGFITETLTTSLAPDSCVEYTFTATADLSGVGAHTIVAGAQVASGDSDLSNSTSTASVINIVPATTVAPEPFDTADAPLLSTVFNEWVNRSDDDLQWAVEIDGTSSTGTGAASDASGDTTSGYAFVETSSGVLGAEAILEIPCLDIGGTYPGLSFAYHMFGATMGSIEVRVIQNDGTSTTIGSIVGQQQDSDTADWKIGTFPLGAFAGEAVTLQIVGIRGSSFTSDMCIDDIQLVEIPAFDIATTAIVEPTEDACGLSAAAPVTVTVTNNGGETISVFQLTLNVDGTNIVADVIDLSPGGIAPGASYDHTFSATADLSGLGAHTITATAFVPGDADPSNDVGTWGITNIVPTALPVDDDFESYALNETVFMDWINRTDDDLQWDTEDGPTGSTGTGPSDDASGLGGQYIYMETSGSSDSNLAVLELPCVDITGTNPALTFAYHMYGAAIGELRVEITEEPAGTTTTALMLVGQQQSSETDPWQDALVSLVPYIGQTVSIRIIGQSSVEPAPSTITFTGDIALDEISVGEVSSLDVELVTLVEPVTGCGLVAGQPVTATIQNVGADTVTQVLMRISVDGIPIVGENFPTVLAPGESTNYTYTTTADLSALGSHFIIIEARSVGDGDLSNGIDTFFLENTVPTSLPVIETLESYSDGNTALNEWMNIDNGEIWEVQTGGTGSIATGPSGANEGVNYLYIESSGAADGDQAILRSPCLDFTSAINPRLDFDYHMYGSSIDFLQVNILSGGVTTTLLTLNGAQDTSETDPWNSASIDLSPAIGSVAEIEIIGAVLADSTSTTFRGDISLDDIRIVDPVPQDVGATSILSSSCDPTISAVVENFGSDTVTQVAMNLSVNGGSPILEPWAVTLAPGESATYTFTATATYTGGLNTVDVSASAFPADGNTANDAAPTSNVNVVGDGFIEDFDSFAEAETDFGFSTQTGTLVWETEAGTTTSTATGPSADPSGDPLNGIYIYMETSSPAVAGDFATLELCADLSGMTNAQVTYAYHMFGGSIDDLVVSVDDGSGPVAVRTITGQQQFATTDPWLRDSVDLSAYDGMQVTIAFTGTMKLDTVTGFTFDGDIALDEIGISEGSGVAACSPAVMVQNMAATVGASAVTLSWDPVPGQVGCRVNGGPLGVFAGSVTIPNPAASSTSFPLAVLAPGTYNARTTCACSITPLVLTMPSNVVVFTVPEPRVGNFSEFVISPNPATDYLNMSFSSEVTSEETIQVTDLLGRVLHAENMQVNEGANTYTISLDDLASGVYFLQIGMGENMTVKQFDVLK